MKRKKKKYWLVICDYREENCWNKTNDPRVCCVCVTVWAFFKINGRRHHHNSKSGGRFLREQRCSLLLLLLLKLIIFGYCYWQQICTSAAKCSRADATGALLCILHVHFAKWNTIKYAFFFLEGGGMLILLIFHTIFAL